MLSRRQFGKTLAGAGALALGSRNIRGQEERKINALPPPNQSGIEHIVVCMMENRSFDHFLGWLPGANGMQAGLTYKDSSGNPHATYHLTDYQGCGHPDPDHSYNGGRIEYDNGKCDGWLMDTANDTYCIGYYTSQDLPFYSNAATGWTTFDNYYAAMMGPTVPNRLYQHCGVTDRTTDSISICHLPTIWDSLNNLGIDKRYYFDNGIPFTFIFGLKYTLQTKQFSVFQSDCAKGKLPPVSFVDPQLFKGETQGTSNDDHPYGDIRNGDYFLNQVYTAVTTSPLWPSTVLVFNFDEWGGFFDHVPPQNAPDVNPQYYLRGFRVPCVIVSPWSPRGLISHNTYDHTSILKMIEWRFGLPALSVRDGAAANIAEVLDFNNPNLNAPAYNVPGPYSTPCPALGPPAAPHALQALYDKALQQGWDPGKP